METNHTLILGWTDKMFSLIKEICTANESRADGSRGGRWVDNDDDGCLNRNSTMACDMGHSSPAAMNNDHGRNLLDKPDSAHNAFRRNCHSRLGEGERSNGS